MTTAKYYIPSGRCIQALDYSHRNEDGSVGNVPDSLISEFTTKKGRIVYDGGGIVPDIVMDSDKLGKLSSALIRNFLVFDFATRFANETASIAPPEKFEITDEIYNQFTAYIKEKDFEYDSESQQLLEDLIETAKKEKYYELASGEFRKIQESLEPHLNKDLNVFKEEIQSLLKNEIVSRFYYQKGAIRSSVGEDKVIQKAVDELHSPMVYQEYFKPGTVISMNK